uniref:Uncharacterized protein n=1 Tax=Rhizophagus irregularis (strain DAOM 181602 / DAOM 197198 / MUCL 43194) TaxID=747089 RepID=U9T8T1_RHIID
MTSGDGNIPSHMLYTKHYANKNLDALKSRGNDVCNQLICCVQYRNSNSEYPKIYLNNWEVNFNEVFEQLNVLDSIHILYCYPLNSAFIQQIINLTKPFKLKSLFMDEGPVSQIESLELLLQKFGQILPYRLEYLSLALKFNINDLEVFFKNSKNTFIKKLLIRNKMYQESEEILPCIKKYAMKEKRIANLAIESLLYYSNNQIVSNKHNIIYMAVKKHGDYVNTYCTMVMRSEICNIFFNKKKNRLKNLKGENFKKPLEGTLISDSVSDSDSDSEILIL